MQKTNMSSRETCCRYIFGKNTAERKNVDSEEIGFSVPRPEIFIF